MLQYIKKKKRRGIGEKKKKTEETEWMNSEIVRKGRGGRALVSLSGCVLRGKEH